MGRWTLSLSVARAGQHARTRRRRDEKGGASLSCRGNERKENLTLMHSVSRVRGGGGDEEEEEKAHLLHLAAVRGGQGGELLLLFRVRSGLSPTIDKLKKLQRKNCIFGSPFSTLPEEGHTSLSRHTSLSHIHVEGEPPLSHLQKSIPTSFTRGRTSRRKFPSLV